MPGNKIIRPMMLSDTEALMPLLVSHFSDSVMSNSLTFSLENTKRSINVVLTNPACVTAIGLEGDVLFGFAAFGLDNVWTREYIASELVFYIRDGYRYPEYSINLFTFALAQCTAKGAKFVYASSVAGYDDAGTNARASNIMLHRLGFNKLPHSAGYVKEL